MTSLRRIAVDAVCTSGWVASAPLRRRRRRSLTGTASVRRVLVWTEVGGVGNLVLLSGLLWNLRRLYPGAAITVMMPPTPLARAVITPELADEILPFDASRVSRCAVLRFARHVLRPRRFDLGLATFFSPTVLTACALAAAGCRYRIAYAETAARGFLNTVTLIDRGGHELDRHLRLLAYAERSISRRVVLLIPPAEARSAQQFLMRHGLGAVRPLLGIHPGCDRINALKRWSAERFLKVIDHVIGAGVADVLVFLGQDDMDLRPAFASRVGARVALVCHESLERVMALTGRCHAFLSNDSGLMHVAAALEVPVVALFGPTDTLKNAPVGRAVTLAAPQVPCRPCYRVPPIACIHETRHCLDHISVDDVIDAITRMLSSVRMTDAPRAGGTTVRSVAHAS